MGNKGSWSDAGTNFCFNAAKTWANKWYESYHVTVDPSSATYDGTLVGINAVKDGTIAAGQDIVLKISSSGDLENVEVSNLFCANYVCHHVAPRCYPTRNRVGIFF